ncbi:hypothetical protein C8J57DRAFT_1526046 [Mycena rebaudengoi]|nr:hypothetical protein C8J57DRAFT_1526046 [Mycena rebaudengoi]
MVPSTKSLITFTTVYLDAPTACSGAGIFYWPLGVPGIDDILFMFLPRFRRRQGVPALSPTSLWPVRWSTAPRFLSSLSLKYIPDVLGRLCDAPAARSAGASYSIFYLPRYIPALMTRLRSGAPPRTLILMNARAFDFYAPWDTPHLPSTSHHSPAALRTAAESPTRLVAVLDVLPPPSSNERAALSQVLQRALGTQRRTRLSNSRCPLPVNSTMHHHHL